MPTGRSSSGLVPSTSVADVAPADAPGTTDRRLPALDGIRAVAVAAVLVFHAGVGWFGGGLLGVDVFFVLSGFLITSLLVARVDDRGTSRFGRFYERRARRLLPGPLPGPAARGRLRRLVRRARHARRTLPGRRPLHAGLRRQLALHPLGPGLLRPLRAAVAAAAHLVAGGRGAVLPGLAGGGPARPAPLGPARPGRGGRPRRSCPSATRDGALRRRRRQHRTASTTAPTPGPRRSWSAPSWRRSGRAAPAGSIAAGVVGSADGGRAGRVVALLGLARCAVACSGPSTR